MTFWITWIKEGGRHVSDGPNYHLDGGSGPKQETLSSRGC